MPDHLPEFFAVTMTSLYHVVYDMGNQKAVATKIIGAKPSKVPVGDVLQGGPMIAVGRQLITYTPEGHGFLSPTTSFERKIERVNTQWWGGHTSVVIGLFLDRPTATTCLEEEKDKSPHDFAQWHESTKAVVNAIGPNHPVFYLCEMPGLQLLPLIAVPKKE